MRRGALVAVLALLVACTASLAGRASGAGTPAADHDIRVALTASARTGRITATGGWRLYDHGGRSTLVRGSRRDVWRVERRSGRLRAVRDDGAHTAWRDGPLVIRAEDDDDEVEWQGRHYRGELLISATDGGLLVVNRLPIEEYVRGVVPLEIGTHDRGDLAAIEAQAVAARSYAWTHLAGPSRPYDVMGTVADQVYGGLDAEDPVTNAAVEATRGLVLHYGGRVVNAPYFSTCGGSTAAASEVWREGDEPYLRPVSDRIPGTDRYYCDIAPRFTWTRQLDGRTLEADIRRYLARYSDAPSGRLGAVRGVAILGHTPSGRVSAISVSTSAGDFTVRGNDIRYVLRSAGGEILESTYFTIATAIGRNGAVRDLTLRGTGYGHGVGMCQWGAIGRARAGQDFRTILRTYYPGTTVAPID